MNIWQAYIAPLTNDYWTIFRESDQDIVHICLFTHANHNRRLSMPDIFTRVGNTLYGLGEGQRIGGMLQFAP